MAATSHCYEVKGTCCVASGAWLYNCMHAGHNDDEDDDHLVVRASVLWPLIYS